MYCPFCGTSLPFLTPFCSSCGKDIRFLSYNDTTEGSPIQHAKSFYNLRTLKKKGRQSYSKKKTRLQRKCVTISVALMELNKGALKPVRGSALLLAVNSESDAEHLQKAAVQKLKDANYNLQDDHYLLLYSDGTRVINIPGTETPFTPRGLKKAVGKVYQRITLYICAATDFFKSSQSSSDSEEIVTKASTAELNSANPAMLLLGSGRSSGTSKCVSEALCLRKCTRLDPPAVADNQTDCRADVCSSNTQKDEELVVPVALFRSIRENM